MANEHQEKALIGNIFSGDMEDSLTGKRMGHGNGMEEKPGEGKGPLDFGLSPFFQSDFDPSRESLERPGSCPAAPGTRGREGSEDGQWMVCKNHKRYRHY